MKVESLDEVIGCAWTHEPQIPVSGSIIYKRETV